MVRDGLFVKVISIPKSFYVSWRLAGLKNAFKLPVMVRFNTVLNALGGRIVFMHQPVKIATLSVGFASSGISDKGRSRSILEIQEGGVVELCGKVSFGHGAKLIVGPKGTLSLAPNISGSAENTIICFNRVSIGKEAALGWYSMIMDNDFHSVEDTVSGIVSPSSAEILIGDRCWLGTKSMVMKGAVIPNGCILAAGSTATKKYHTENTLLAGIPAAEKKANITKSTKGDILL